MIYSIVCSCLDKLMRFPSKTWPSIKNMAASLMSSYTIVWFQIAEKNKRIAKIYQDLNMNETVTQYSLSTKEKPELLLTVDDDEVT
mgnify:CR=1 FL=1